MVLILVSDLFTLEMKNRLTLNENYKQPHMHGLVCMCGMSQDAFVYLCGNIY